MELTRIVDAAIALGGNLPSWAGEPAATLTTAAKRLNALGRVVSRSSLYATAPVGVAEQPRFVNAVILLETALEPLALLHELLSIEQEFGRDRTAGIVNGPRTLDLDLLLHEDCILDLPALQLPHPRLAERAFVLVPLAEAAPDAVDPRSGRTAAELLRALRAAAPEAPEAVARIEFAGW
jgi:2-amino-4-hydroxy-6-hydroxymethyldihydropteridine diphosphokinase